MIHERWDKEGEDPVGILSHPSRTSANSVASTLWCPGTGLLLEVGSRPGKEECE